MWRKLNMFLPLAQTLPWNLDPRLSYLSNTHQRVILMKNFLVLCLPCGISFLHKYFSAFFIFLAVVMLQVCRIINLIKTWYLWHLNPPLPSLITSLPNPTHLRGHYPPTWIWKEIYILPFHVHLINILHEHEKIQFRNYLLRTIWEHKEGKKIRIEETEGFWSVQNLQMLSKVITN